MAESFLIISASMGAGHDGAAKELAARLEAQGHTTEIIDFLKCAKGVGGLIKKIYQYQLEVAPWSYELLYRVFFKLPSLYRPLVWLTTYLSSFRIRKAIEKASATCVITTYPLASLVLGKERQRGRISIPAVTFVTDFAVHPLWVHPGMDLNLCVHPQAAQSAWDATHRPSLAPGPMVPKRFFDIQEYRQTNVLGVTPQRRALRDKFQIPQDATAILVVAGSWGVGELNATFQDLAKIGRYFPVIVCGSNEQLYNDLSKLVGNSGRVLGWTKEMDQLMAACDVLLQNAGGLTCMEAFAAKLPVVTYRPIPGHGVENALEMERAQVAGYARTLSDLPQSIERAIDPGALVRLDEISQMFAQDPAEIILEFNEVAPRPSTVKSSRPERLFRGITSKSAGALMAFATLYSAFSFGGNVAVAHGLDAVKPSTSEPYLYSAVKLNNSLLNLSGVASLLVKSHISLIVTSKQIKVDPHAIGYFYRQGVNIENGGSPNGDDPLDVMVPNTTVSTTANAIAKTIGKKPQFYVSQNSVSGFDLSEARLVHEKVIRPSFVLSNTNTNKTFGDGDVIVVKEGGHSLSALEDSIASLIANASQQGLRVTSLNKIS